MRKGTGKRMIAFFMAFIMVLSVMFQSDMAIGGFAKAFASVTGDKVATATDADDQSTAQIAADLINLDEEGYVINIDARGKSMTYTEAGATITPRYIKVQKNGTTLASSNYSVSYENNDKVGTATVIVTGKEEKGYTGELRQTFTITQKVISSARCFYLGGNDAEHKYNTASYPSFAYVAGGNEPKVYIKSGTTASAVFLTENVDYKVSYINVDEAGAADPAEESYGPFVRIDSVPGSNYKIGTTGEYMLYFSITLADISDESKVAVQMGERFPYTGKEIKPEIHLVDKDNNKELNGINDYEYSVSYSNNINIGTGTVVINGCNNRYTGNITKNFQIVAAGNIKDLTDAEVKVSGTYVYDGTEKKPEPTVTYKGTTLVKGRDYKIVSYSNNVNASTASKKATVRISGIGDYAGDAETEFTVSPRDINEATYTTTESVYNPNNSIQMSPGMKVTVMDGDKALVVSTDYYLDFTRYTSGKKYDIGVYEFEIKGKGNYTGVKVGTFEIVQADIEKAVIAVDPVEYTGSPVTPVPSVVKFNGSTIKEGVDYEIDGYENNTNVGSSAKITIRGINNFKGTATGTFTIKTEKISMASVTIGDLGKTVYTGSQVRPTPELTYDGKTLTEGTDYTVTYGENILPGDATITYLGMGDYAGSVDVTFRISEKNLRDDDVICTYTKDYIYTGEVISPEVSLTYNGMQLVEGVDYKITTWAKDPGNDQFVYIDSVASMTTKYVGSKTLRVNILAPSGDIAALPDPEIEDQYYTGKAIIPDFELKNDNYTLKNGVDYTVTGSSNVEVGTAVLTITGMGTYEGGEKIVKFKILPKPIEDCTISYSSERDYAMGLAVNAAVTVKNGDVTMKAGTDYTISYDNNTDATTEASFTITPKSSNYTGDPVTKTFTINPLKLQRSGNGFSMSSISDQQYTGKAITPSVTIKRTQNGVTYPLVQDKDYTVEYSDNNTDVGSIVTVTISGTGNFGGTINLTFSIVKRELSQCEVEDIGDQLYTGSEITPNIVIKNGDVTLEAGTDFTVKFEDNTEAGTATAVITGAGVNYTGTVRKQFKIVKEFINLEDNEKLTITGLSDQVYAFGKALTPDFTLKYDGSNMAVRTDYTYEFSDNINAGTATVTITGVGKYVGSREFTFKIQKYDISNDVLVIDTDNVEYTGQEIKPAPAAIQIDGVSRINSFDGFKIDYGNNINAGTGKITVTAGAIGNYTGSITKTFTIRKQDISSAAISVDDVTYTGKAQTPKIVVKLANGNVLSSDDYTVEYKDNKDIGTASVIVTAAADSNYTGTTKTTFKILALDLSKAVITKIEDQTYTGSEICPDLEVKYGDKLLVEGEDYVVDSYDNNESVTTADKKAVVTVKGKGIYSGTCSAEFNIVPASIENAVVSGYEKNVVYTGSKITFSQLVVKVGGRVLTVADYKVAYSNNINVTTESSPAKLTITAMGNYTGEIIIEFAIEAKSLEECTVLPLETQIYTGKALAPDVTVSDGSKVLEKGTDYTVAYSNNTNVTTAQSKAVAKITGMGNYTGEIQVKFDIAKQTVKLTDDNVADIPDQTYHMGDEIKPEVTVTVAGTKLDPECYTVTYDNNINAGTAKVTVTGLQEYVGTIEKTFTINPLSIAAAVPDKEYTAGYSVDGVTFSVESFSLILDGKTYKITDMKDFTVTQKNLTNAGKGTITVAAKAGTNFTGSFDIAAVITPAVIGEANVSLDQLSYEYTGSEIKPEPVVKNGKTVLKAGTDYTLTYSGNINAGDAAYVTVTGRGNYSGTAKIKFVITAKSIAGAKIAAVAKTYTGASLTTDITVTLGEKTLKEGTDYTVEYDKDGNTAAGTGSFTVTGKGNYTGKLDGTFDINPKSINSEDIVVTGVEDKIYTGDAVLQDIIVKDGDIVLKEGVDYTVTYENNIKTSTADSKAAVVIRGKGNYDSTTVRKIEFSIGKISMENAEIEGVADSVEYTGAAIVFGGLTVTVAGRKLTVGTDYTVSYADNINVTADTNLAKVTVKAAADGNYTGSVTRTFVITARNLANCDISDIEGQIYTGKPVTPDVEVRDGAKTLVKDTDYDIEYSNNTNVTTEAGGLAIAKITGKGNYTGEVEKTFSIAKEIIDISQAVVTITDKGPFVYSFGDKIEPKVSVTLGDKVLADDAYTVSYTDNVNAGKASITVTGTGDYKGQTGTTFVIEQYDIGSASLVLESNSYEYTGSEIKPAVKNIAIEGREIAPGSDFDITYSNNKDKGTGSVTLTARANTNYKGTVSAAFKIGAADISNANVTVSDAAYTGQPIKPDVTVILGTKKLTEGTDYTVDYTDNTDAGTATVTVKGIGNYTGTVDTQFKITAKSLSLAVVTAADQTYTGRELTPDVTVTLDGKKIADTEYDVKYTSNVNKGTSTITVTGKHNYTGSKTGTFKILAKDISECDVSEVADVVYNGKAQTPEITVKNGDVELKNGVDYEAVYNNNTEVSTTGKKAEITITGHGNYTGQKVVSFIITRAAFADVVITGIPESEAYTGGSIVLTGYEVTAFGVKLTEDKDYTVSYKNNKEVGTATVTFTGAGNFEGSRKITFEIVQKDIADCQVTPIPGQKWTGREITPEVTVKNGSVLLVKGTDYTVEYSGNIDVTDKAEVKITGQGNYTGSTTVYFSISRSVVSISTATVSAIPAQTYAMGAEIKPAVNVVYDGMELAEGKDYTVSYENNINAGTAEVVITGSGYYSGSKTVSFVIEPLDVSDGKAILESDTFVYNGKAQTPVVAGIEMGNIKITDISSFDMACKDNTNVGIATVTLTAKDNTNFKGSVTAEFEITAADISSAMASAEDVVYQGIALSPSVKVTFSGAVLTEGRDYEVSYSNNVNVGKGEALIKGTGNYKGQLTVIFNITQRALTGADVTVGDQVYTGKALTPKPVVTLSGKTLTQDVDYTVTYEKNVNVGTANVIITGIGNFKDSVKKSFKIAGADIGKAEVSKIEDQVYTGDEIKPEVTVTSVTGEILTAGVDYSVTYTGNVNVTTDDAPAQAVISGKGNYTGTVKVTFAIVPKNIEGADVSGYSESVAYTGVGVEFANIVVADGADVLTAGVDYTISYTGNKSVTTDEGTYFTVSGKGNYTGTKDIHFTITRKNIKDCDVQAIESQVWTGKEIEPSVTIRNGSSLLVSGTDYDVTYKNNINETTDTSKASAVITGKGNYTGTITREFIIARILTDISKAEIAAIPAQTYDFGREITPDVVIKYDGKVLTKNVDYKLDYTDNINAGTATVNITGIGGYNKSVSKTFVIKAADISDGELTLKGTTFVYTGEEITPAVTRLTLTVGDSTEIIADLTSFDVKYTDNVNAGQAVVTLTAKSGTNYTGTAKKTFQIGRASITDAVVEATSPEYTGDAVTPDITVRMGEKILENGVDYEVSYKDNTETGDKASFTITGKGNYTGVISRSFEIMPKSIADGECEIPAQVYTGSDITPDITLKLDGKILVSGRDYTVSYADNRDVTTEQRKAEAVITAMGNYTGKLTVQFDITAKTILPADVSDIEAQEYTGSAIEPAVTVKNGTTILVEGRDYDVTYSDNVDKTKSAKAVVTGKGNYRGVVTKTFEICATSIAAAVVTGIPESVVYTGESITFGDIQVKLNGKTMVYGSDYTVNYENNVNVTTDDAKAYVVIKGIDNYGGQLKVAFDITPKDISGCKVDAINGQIYTGREITPDVTVRDGKTLLEKDVDYTVTYENNIEITKSAKAVIKGKGNYAGVIEAEFSISKEVLDISAATIGKIADEYYNFGEELTPNVVVTLNGKTLKKGVDYEVAYRDNVKPGTATVTVMGIDQNKGEVSSTFKILPIDITDADITLVKDTFAYTGNAINAEISKVTVKRNGTAKTLTDLTGLTYSCSGNVNVGKALLTLTAEDGMGFANTATATYNIAAASIESAEISADSAVYTGEKITPVCRVTLAGKTLVPGTDYTVVASNNINVTDKAVLTITGKGNYTGKVTGYFSITPKRISEAEVSVDPAEYTGKALQPELTVVLDGKTLTDGVDYTADYSDNVNVTTGNAKASVTITGKGNYMGTVTGEFAITPMDVSKLSIEDIPDQVYAGQAVRPEIIIRNGDVALTAGVDYSVEYQNNDAVTKSAKAVITGKGNYKGSVTKTFAITAFSIEGAEISGIADTVVYSGEDIEFSDIKVTVNGVQLVNGTDYTVTYKNNHDVTTDESPAYVTITGKGNYGGEMSRTFVITARNIARCSIDPIGGQTYTGLPVTPDVVVRDGAIILEKDKDYTVSYSNNTDVTESAEVTVTGKGNYKGVTSTVFTIAKEIIDISKAVISKPDDQYYDFGKQIKPEVTLTYNGKQLARDVDYELVYINNTKEGTATIQANGINTNTGSVSTIFEILPIDISDAVVTLENEEYEYTGKEIKPAVRMITVNRSGKTEAVTSLDGFNVTYDSNINVGTANVTVTAVKGSGFTGKTARTFAITGVDMSDALVEITGSYVYTGKAITPQYTVTLGGKVLTEGEDYKVSLSNNVNVGKRAMLTVTGSGNYTGKAVAYFEITAKNISSADVKAANATYTGKPATPDVTVTLDGEILNAGIDYTISYSNNVNATTDKTKAAVVVKGTGNYTGSVTGTFDIAPKDISDAVIGDIEAQNYTGKEVTPEVSVSLDGKVLTAGTDYSVSYDNNIAASEDAEVIVTGRGNYTGTISKKFAIQNVKIDDAMVTGIEESVVYTGKDITFDDIMVTVSGKTLSEDVDYTVSYEDNKNVTTAAKVVITGIGNYSGVITRTFAITPKNIDSCSVDAVSGQIYTGKAITPDVTVRDGAEVLVLDKDYTVAYSNNVEVTTSDNMAVITVTGKGNYTGKTTVTFAISKKLTDISKAVISKIADQYYNFGQPLTPDVKVTLNGKELVNGTDYALVYVDNTDEGTATVMAKGINSNTGAVTAKFNIKPVDISDGVIALDAASYLYTGTAVKPVISSFTVKRLGKTVKVTDFTNLDITYSSNSNVGTGKVTITALEGEGFTGSVSKTFAIVGASVENAVVRVENGVYTGEEIQPAYVVTLGGRTLVEGKDFRADFSNNVNATDSAVLTVTGINNYSGTKTVRFTISPRKITDADVTVAAARYTGQELAPAVKVVIGTTALVQDVDFTVDYSDNVNVTDDDTKASVKITGKGNYTGSVTEEFDITPRDISLVDIKDIENQAYTGNPVTPELTITDGASVLKAGRDYVVSYRNNINVTAEAEACITGMGNYAGTVSKIFAITGADIKDAVVTGVKSSVTYTGSEITFAGLKVAYAGETLVAGRDYTVTYSGNRNVTDKAEIRITGKGNYSGTVIKTFAITRKNIADSDCHVGEIEGQIYTGKEIEPEVVVTYGDITLVEDVDYEITYSNNIAESTKDSPAKAVITGKGSYTGTVTREFTITKEPVNISGAKISAIADQEFAKAYITPEVSVTYAGSKLVEGTDYKVSYSNNYKVGTATVYITGYGNYVGSKRATFNIVKRDITGYVASLAQTVVTYTGKAITPDVISITDRIGSFVIDDEELDGFVIKYSANVNAGTAKVTATAGSGSNYSGSVIAEFVINPAQIDGAAVTAETVEYTGKAVTPAVTVTKNGMVLTSDDYSVEYRNNTEVGTADIIVSGTGNYTGTEYGTFTITPRSIKNCSITVSGSTEYTGGQIVPVVTVKNGAQVLAEGVDYILSYDLNTDVTSKAKVVITGKGNYKDSVTRYFAITKKSISKAVISGVTDKEFTGNAITQNIEVKLDGEKLVQGTDYTVKYTNNVHVGTATVTITGAGNYTDSVKRNFVINRVDVSNTAVITGIEPEATYNGTEFKFKNVKITWSGIVLKEGKDYTISYKNNSGITMTRTSKASCTISFIGDYKGKVTKQFRIKAFDISKATVSAIKDVTYTGKTQTPAVVVKIGSTVINSKEYEVKYSNNVKPGVATVTITGLNNFYGTKKVTFNILPAKVAKLMFSSSKDTSVGVKWNAVKYAAGYVVYYSKDGGKSYVKAGTTANTSYTISKLASGQIYKVKVCAYVKITATKSLLSAGSVVDTATKPGKVTGITCSARTDTAIKATWKAVSGATGYKVYKWDNAGRKYVTVGVVKTNSVTVKGLKASTAYKIKVVAYKQLGSKILWGAENAATIMTTPAAVKGLKAATGGMSSVKLSWGVVSSADGYIVYRLSGKKYVSIGRVRSNKTTTFVSSKLKAGTLYKYKVVAYKVSGKSTIANAGTTVSAVTLPVTPVVTVQAGKGKATLAWNRVSGADGYEVYISTTKTGKLTKVATLGKTVKKYTKSGLVKNKTYYVCVRAFKKGPDGKKNYSAYSTKKPVKIK